MIEWFRKSCESGDRSRRALAREFCTCEQWFDDAGRPNRASASLLLLKLTDRLWESMLETHPPEGWHRAPGGLIQYWIVSSVEGVLGGLGFCAAPMQLAPRDHLIGWSNKACIANIGLSTYHT